MNSKTECILLVDDDEDTRQAVALMLEAEGYRTDHASNGEEGLQKIASGSYDLLLLDLTMPRLDGMDVLRILRQLYAPGTLPVVLMSAKDSAAVQARAMNLGANDFITKPVDPTVLLARVRHHLRIREAVTGTHPVASPEDSGSSGPVEIGVGAVLGDKYRLLEEIGVGGHGSVYRAEHLALGTTMAVKVMRPGTFASEEVFKRFENEGKVLGRLQHPNVVRIFDIDSVGSQAYLVMELLHGRTVREELLNSGRFHPEYAVTIAISICDVLDKAHSVDLLHRDIKPDNIFLHRDRGMEQVKVLDFGIAKYVDAELSGSGITLEGMLLGTPAFMSPERLNGLPSDARSDVYSVAVVLYNMLAGEPPFQVSDEGLMALGIKILTEPPPPLQVKVPGIDPSLAQVVLNALVKTATARPSAETFAFQLAAALGVDAEAERNRVREGETVFERLNAVIRSRWSMH
jgi:CheY-like chemotaxis protein